MSPLTILAGLVLAAPSEVSVGGARWAAMQPGEEVPPPAPGPFLHGAEVTLSSDGDHVSFRARYRVSVPRSGWLTLALAPSDAHLRNVRFNGRTLPTAVAAGGLTAVWFVREEGTLLVEGTVRRRVGESLGLLPVAGVLRIEGDTLAVAGALPRGDGVALVTAAPLVLAEPSPPVRAAGDLVLGEAAVGLTVGDAVVAGQARLRWRIARGRRSEVSFRLDGAGDDLDVTGPLVASVRRAGSTVTVQLTEPATSLVQLEAEWTRELGTGDEVDVQVPVPQLDATFRTTHVLTLARDSTHEVVPRVQSAQAVPSSSLPAWAEGLVQGQTTASFASDQRPTASVQVLRVSPAQGPSTLVDVASYRVATTSNGRALLRAHYAVRNDRGAHLRLVPPPGLVVVSARVAGDPAELGRDGDAYLVPLARSVETLEGLITFPVEITLLGEGREWVRRGEYRLPLPTIDAPIAVSRATVFLPPDRRTGRKPASNRIVEAFTEGQSITYGFAAGDARAAEADAMFQEAVSAWMSNDFDEAQELLEDLGELGAQNADVQRLQSNLTYVIDGSAAGADVRQARRVKEMARARAEKDVVEQRRVLEEAEEQYAAGDYEAADASYSRALELGRKREQIAADEDQDVSAQNRVVERKRTKARVKYKERTEIDFDGVDVSGELVRPQGNLILDRKVAVSPEPASEPVMDEPDELVSSGSGREEELEAVQKEVESVVLATEEVVVAEPAQATVGVVTGERRSRLRLRGIAAGRSRSPKPPPKARKRRASAAPEPDSFPPPTVTAASASVVIPELGESVLYQRRLLPAGAADEVVLSVRPRRKR